MRALLLYLMFGVASSFATHSLHFGDLIFWRDVVAWPLVALNRVVDLSWLLTPRGQDWASVCFGAALVLYAIGRFESPFRSRAKPSRARRLEV